MPGTTPDAVGKVVGFLTLMAVLPVFSLSLPLSFVFGSPSVWGFGEKYRRPSCLHLEQVHDRDRDGVRADAGGPPHAAQGFEVRVPVQPPRVGGFLRGHVPHRNRADILSRYLVVYVFPLFAVPAMAVGAVFAFKRNKPGAHDALNKQLDDHMMKFPDFSGLVVYPEGTRNIRYERCR